MFTEYLLTEVGFSKCEVISTPLHPQKGFQRPIKVFTKGETPLSSRTPRTETGSQGERSQAATPGHEPAVSSQSCVQQEEVTQQASGEPHSNNSPPTEGTPDNEMSCDVELKEKDLT